MGCLSKCVFLLSSWAGHINNGNSGIANQAEMKRVY